MTAKPYTSPQATEDQLTALALLRAYITDDKEAIEALLPSGEMVPRGVAFHLARFGACGWRSVGGAGLGALEGASVVVAMRGARAAQGLKP